MPLTELDPNVSGRNSRASGTSSAHTRESARRHGGKGDLLSATPGVMSMLRTTTEIGDVASLALPARNARPGQASHRSSGRTSAASTRSGSAHPRSNHHAWPSASSAPRGSITSNLTVPDQLLQQPSRLRHSPQELPSLQGGKDGRSFSLTDDIAVPALALGNHRSMTSLRLHDPLARPRSPFVYPTRLKRPGYRAPSPALSDITGMHFSKPPPAKVAPYIRMHSTLPIRQSREQKGLPYPQVRTISAPSTASRSSHAEGYRTMEPSPPLRDVASSAPPIIAPAPLRVRRSALRTTPSPTPMHGSSRDLFASADTPDHTGSSMEVMPSPSSGTEPTVITQVDPATAQLGRNPSYYDYSEPFHLVNTKASGPLRSLPSRSSPTVPNGFVYRIRTLLEDRTGEHGPFANGDGSAPNIMPAELPGDRSLVELPADDVPEAIRRMRQAQAEHAAAHAENLTMETIAHLITDVREQNELDATPDSNATSASGSGNEEEPTPKKKNGKRLSIISEAASNATKSTSQSAAVEVAVRYSIAASVPSSESYRRLAPPEEDVDTHAPDAVRETDSEEPEADQDDTLKPSSEADETEPSTGSIKVATEIVLERKQEELSLLEPRSTPNRSRSLEVPLSTPSQASARRSAPNGYTTWASSDPEASSSDATPSDVAIRISIPVIPRRPSPTGTLKSARDIQANTNSGTSAAVSLEAPIVVNVTQATETLTIETMSPVSPLVDDTLCDHRGSPVSPLAIKSVVATKPLHTEDNTPALPRQSFRDSQRTAEIKSNRTDSSDGTIKEVVAQYFEPFEMSTTDLRFSQLRHTSGASKPLPDVQEEPTQTTSQADMHISSFNFPRPGRARRGSFDSAVGRLSKESARIGRASIITITHNNALADIRGIPSLRFSSINLVDQLNNALGHRHTRSLEAVGPIDGPMTGNANADMRERYKSFFASLDGLNDATYGIPDEPQQEDGGNEVVEPVESMAEAQRTPEQALAELQRQATQHKELNEQHRPSIHMIQRSRSPQTIIDEVNRLTIPEVNGLTQRLSDLIPSLKHFYRNDEITEDANVELTLNEIRSLGRRRIVRADGRVISLVKEDSWVLPEQAVSLDESSHPSLEDPGSKRTSTVRTLISGAATESDGKAGVAADGPPTIDLSRIDLVQLPAPVVTRGRSLTDSYGIVRSSSKIHLDSNDSRRSLLVSAPPRSSSFDVRPWNFDVNYPWTNTNIDISFPARAFQRDSPNVGPSKLRNSESNSNEEQASITDNARDLTDEAAHNEDNTRSTEDTFSNQRHRNSRRSLIGTVTRRIGNTLSSQSRHGNGLGVNSVTSAPAVMDAAGFALSADLLNLREGERVVDPGDRYPTTGLSPPNVFNLDDVRSFFSDDSSIRDTGARDGLGISKRFTKLRMGMSRAASAMDSRHIRPDDALELGMHQNGSGGRIDGIRTAASAGAHKYRHLQHGGSDLHVQGRPLPFDGAESPSLTTGYDGSRVQGMSKAEFRTQKLIEKIKVLWYRGGELIRSLSGKTKKEGHDGKAGLGYGFVPEKRMRPQDAETYSGT